MKKIAVIILTMVLFLQTSCIPTYYSVKTNVLPAPNTKLVVVTGMFDDSTTDFAELLTQEFQRKTRFSVIPQKLLKRNNKHYPIKIKGPFTSSFFKIREDYRLTDKEKVLKYARSVQSDFVYVVWIPVSNLYKGSAHEFRIIGQMLDVKTGREVGRGKYDVHWFTGAYIGWGAARTHDEALKQGATFAVKEIAEKMKMVK
ncbi:MAG: hypothetical protein PF637_12315 [Spirochaetes bacterium]|jgi:hypothetical protein|nr:hypothetical protein [Spirochaetota bacterium]